MESPRNARARKETLRWTILLVFLMLAGGLWVLTGETNSVEAAREPRPTKTSTPTRTATLAPIATATSTATPLATTTATATSSATPTRTSTAIPTSTPTLTSTPPPSPDLALTVYGDALAGGWSNWSWNSDVSFSTTSPVYSGTRTIAFSVTAAWGALYVHTDAGLETSPYSSLASRLGPVRAASATGSCCTVLRTSSWHPARCHWRTTAATRWPAPGSSTASRWPT